MKKENDASKRLKRLKKSLGGDLRLIHELEGSECHGTVKAASKTGDWVYVEPDTDGLPVGVAAMSEELSGVNSGDRVRVRIEGVDEERGQLALQVLEKL
jgi:predicted RNA-binding protein (virulence factor B family)